MQGQHASLGAPRQRSRKIHSRSGQAPLRSRPRPSGVAHTHTLKFPRLALDPFDIGSTDQRITLLTIPRIIFRQSRKLTHQAHQALLQGIDQPDPMLVRCRRARHSQRRVQLIDAAQGLNPRRGLGDLFAKQQIGLA